MKIPDKFISKLADPAIKVLVLFVLIYVCIMFVHVETHHTKFSKSQAAVIENNLLLITLLTNHHQNAMDILKNQVLIQRDVEVALYNQKSIKEHQKILLEFIGQFQTNNNLSISK